MGWRKTNPKAGDKEIQRALHKEGERILALLSSDELVVALDSRGKMLTSEELSAQIEKWNVSGLTRINLVVVAPMAWLRDQTKG